ncbi:MAG: DUF1501 domain-containing protein [Verrucomicrobiae bacterium]|nr:DUF1501 domain-containing protein [Verrucomicrobiae bacterium]
MPDPDSPRPGHWRHAFTDLNPLVREGLTVHSRRGMLKAGLAGMAGLSFPDLLRARAANPAAGSRKSVILLWMTGGPSHIDTWDPKPEAPLENRGPFGTIPTKLTGVRLSEHYPKQAAMMDKLTLIRSMVCKGSSHQPNQVMQTGNLGAAPRIFSNGKMWPAVGSLVAKHHGPNDPQMPPYVALNVQHPTHIAWGGYLGKQFDPYTTGKGGANFKLPTGLTMDRLQSRQTLFQQMDTLRANVDQSGEMEGLDHFNEKAFELVAGGKAQEAFDLSKESPKTIERYGDHEWSQQALLARRLVEAGSSFVTIDLSKHPASGTWDNHGIPGGVYGGITKGLKPLMPVFDHLFTTLVSDLEERGILDDTLVIAMGEFGRTPQIGTQGSQDGRNHWPVVMSMMMAGGGFRHGQVIGATEKDGGDVKERPVYPGDLAATIYHHFGVPQDTMFTDFTGRPHFAVQDGGRPIAEMV